MNNWSGMGRLTKDPEVKHDRNGQPYMKFTLACDRRWKKDSADFVPCTAFGQSAEYLGSYAMKGTMVEVIGSIQTGSYEGKNGTVYTVDVRCEYVHIVGQGKKEETVTEPNSLKVEVKPDDLPIY